MSVSRIYESSLYRSSGRLGQEWLLSARSAAVLALREGRRFRRLLAEAQTRQWWSAEALAAYRLDHLRALLAHAADHIPYWRSVLATIGACPQDFRTLDDFHRLPPLTRDEVRAAGKGLTDGRRGLLTAQSSGTTNSPLTVWQTLEAINQENAFVWRQLGWAGCKPGDRRIWLRGDLIVPVEHHAPPYWRLDRLATTLYMSSYHLSVAAAGDYVDAMERWDPVVIQSYPSSISFLARCLEASGRRYQGRSLRGVVVSSETLTREARDVIAARFGCPVFNWYGNVERTVAAGTCEAGGLHLMDDYGWTELEPNGPGTAAVIATGFSNPAMPLFRYGTGDEVELAPPDARCPCGRHFRLIGQVLGRMDDVVKTPAQRVVGRITHVFEGLPGVVAGQIIQERLDGLRILIVPSEGYGDNVGAELQRRLTVCLGEGLDMTIETVTALERGGNGKIRGVVNRL